VRPEPSSEDAGSDGLSADGANRLSQIIPDFEQRFARVIELAEAQHPTAEIELTTERAVSHLLPVVHPALMENNLARKGIWSTDADHGRTEYVYETEDLIGSLTIEYSMGQLSTADMELVSWVMGRWRPGQTKINFTMREYMRASKVKWGGSQCRQLKNALHRIDRTRFTGRVWEQKKKRFTTRHFGIFDDVVIVERKDGFEVDATSSDETGTVTITLSTFVLEQLDAQQFVRLNWSILRGTLKTPLSRRLYVFLESQRGFQRGTIYEVTIDNKFIDTLGSKDKNNPCRFRAKLLKAGEEIVAADSRYECVRIRAGQQRNAYVLQVRRKAAA
jgi:hypothetical protein